MAKVWYPPPGQITTALPVAIFSRGKNTSTRAVSFSSILATAGFEGHRLRVIGRWAMTDVAVANNMAATNKNLLVLISFVNAVFAFTAKVAIKVETTFLTSSILGIDGNQ